MLITKEQLQKAEDKQSICIISMIACIVGAFVMFSPFLRIASSGIGALSGLIITIPFGGLFVFMPAKQLLIYRKDIAMLRNGQFYIVIDEVQKIVMDVAVSDKKGTVYFKSIPNSPIRRSEYKLDHISVGDPVILVMAEDGSGMLDYYMGKEYSLDQSLYEYVRQ